MRITRRTPLAAALLVLLLAVTGCTQGSPSSEKSTMQSTAPPLAKEDAISARRAYVAALNTQLGGGKLTDYSNSNPDPCEKDTVERPSRTFSVTGFYDTTMPTTQQLATLDHLRHQWQRDGWQIGTWATAYSGDRHLSGLDPTNHYDVALLTDLKAGFLDITIGTPCYRYPTAPSGQATDPHRALDAGDSRRCDSGAG